MITAFIVCNPGVDTPPSELSFLFLEKEVKMPAKAANTKIKMFHILKGINNFFFFFRGSPTQRSLLPSEP